MCTPRVLAPVFETVSLNSPDWTQFLTFPPLSPRLPGLSHLASPLIFSLAFFFLNKVLELEPPFIFQRQHLTMFSKLALISQQSFCLSLLNVRIIGVCHYAQPYPYS